MKHHPELFNARTLQNDTRLLFKLKLLLGTVCAYEGEVPLSEKELATRLQTSTYRIRLLLKKLEIEEVIHYDENGKLFFNRYRFIQEKEESSKKDLYSKNFVFFTCDEFLSEDRNVQRFVLHAVGYKLVYLPKTFYWENVDALYGEMGLLNIRTRKEALKVLEKSAKYLIIRMSKNKNNFQITGVHKQWLDLGEINSEGSLLWVGKQLKKHHFCFEFISKKAIIQITKVMEYYYAQFGYSFATEIFDTALYNIQKHPERSHAFYQMIYREDDNYSENELNEISAYFRAVMQSTEISYSVQLSMELDSHQTTKYTAETELFANGELQDEKEALLQESNKKINLAVSKLSLIQKSWMKRVEKEPIWLLKNKDAILKLPGQFFEIKRALHDLDNQYSNSFSISEDELPF